jgi:hypothetical protein
MPHRHQFGEFCRLLLLTLGVTALPALVSANDFKPVYRPSLNVSRSAGEIKIDGRLQDAGWQGAAVADNFVENDPGDQIKPPVDTKAYVTYDSDRLYVAIVCYDDPTQVRATMCERDRLYSEDNVGVFFDTYGDAAWAYTLNVNPYGIQADALWSNGYGEDATYDLIWESAGQITDSGWQVELAIPFASLRFPNQSEQTWKMEFWRHHYRDIHRNISWTAYDRNESCWACQWGTVTGIRDVKPGRGIEIMPSLVGFQSGALQEIPWEDSTTRLRFSDDDPDGDISVNTKYAISSNATAEISINPDFSQVEADADQIDVNSVTALSFPEKRPFFQEGSDLFRGQFDVVYTRSINDPLAAAKFTMRSGRTSLAYLGAYDEHSPLVIPFEEGSSSEIAAGESYSNIVRLRQTLGAGSQTGLLLTDRRYDGGGSGTALSVDGSFRLSKSLQFTTQVVATHTEEIDDTTLWNEGDLKFDNEHTATLDGESFWGHAYTGELIWNAADYSLSTEYSERSSSFRVDNGWEPLNDRRQLGAEGLYVFRFNDGVLQDIYPDIQAGRVWNTDGIRKDEYVYADVSADFRKWQLSLHSQYMISNELYQGTDYRGIWNYHQCIHVTPCNWLSFGGSLGYGDQIAYDYRILGRQLRLGVWADFKPGDRVLIENTLSHVRSKNPDTDYEYFEGYIARSRLSVQFNRRLSLRFVTQYNDFGETWDLDPLITYRINPFTMFYVGTTYDYKRYHDLTDDGSRYVKDGEMSYDQNRLTSRQFFMKIQYLFQL